MADDSTLLENTEVGSTIVDSLIRFVWKCGTFLSGIIVLAAGVLYVKVCVLYVCLIPLYAFDILIISIHHVLNIDSFDMCILIHHVLTYILYLYIIIFIARISFIFPFNRRRAQTPSAEP